MENDLPNQSKLLIDEHPLQVLPSLALKVGLNEAIILQQIHYWLKVSEHVHDGRKWIFNTYDDWQKQFPFWSTKTIKRAILKLESQGYLLSRSDLNKFKIDSTKWYSIEYQKLNENQVDVPPVGTKCPAEQPNLSPPAMGQSVPTNNQRLSETTTREIKDIVRSPQNGHSDVTQKIDKQLQKETVYRVVDYLNRKLGTKYQEKSKITANLIKARLADGFAPEDFKTVIDKKVKEWRNTEMEQYLRPPTLFGMKFESYLNQNGERHRKGEGGIIWDIPKEELMK